MPNDLIPAMQAPAPVQAVDETSTRTKQEMEAACILAKRFPRDENQRISRILAACGRPSIADEAIYAVERGKDRDGNTTFARGPSIGLARLLGQLWGNIQFGTRTIDATADYSEIEAYAWDLESNARSSYVFKVQHWRHKKGGGYKVDDPQQIYEITLARASRYQRRAILDVIPPDVLADAIEVCEATLKKAESTGDISDRVARMFAGFAEFGIGESSILGSFNKNADELTPDDLVELKTKYLALKDGAASPADFGWSVSKAEAKTEADKKVPAMKKAAEAKPGKPESKPVEPPLPAKVEETASADVIDVIPDDLFR